MHMDLFCSILQTCLDPTLIKNTKKTCIVKHASVPFLTFHHAHECDHSVPVLTRTSLGILGNRTGIQHPSSRSLMVTRKRKASYFLLPPAKSMETFLTASPTSHIAPMYQLLALSTYPICSLTSCI